MPFHQGLGDVLGDILDVGKELAPDLLKLQVLRTQSKLAAKLAKATARGAQPAILPVSTSPFVQQAGFPIGPTLSQGGPFGGSPEVQMAGFEGTFPGTGLGAEVVCSQMFRRNRLSIRPARLVIVQHPETGEPVFFGNLGKPLLFSRDMSAARRVKKLAMRARRASKR